MLPIECIAKLFIISSSSFSRRRRRESTVQREGDRAEIARFARQPSVHEAVWIVMRGLSRGLSTSPEASALLREKTSLGNYNNNNYINRALGVWKIEIKYR